MFGYRETEIVLNCHYHFVRNRYTVNLFLIFPRQHMWVHRYLAVQWQHAPNQTVTAVGDFNRLTLSVVLGPVCDVVLEFYFVVTRFGGHALNDPRPRSRFLRIT